MQISFAAGDPLKQDQYIPPSESAHAPTILVPTAANELYTLLMFDNDAPFPAPLNEYSPFLHWLVVNIAGSTGDTLLPESGNTLVSYTGPSPPKQSPSHRYHVQVYRQPSRKAPQKSYPCPNFDVDGFVRDLSKLGEFDFLTGHTPPRPTNGPLVLPRKIPEARPLSALPSRVEAKGDLPKDPSNDGAIIANHKPPLRHFGDPAASKKPPQQEPLSSFVEEELQRYLTDPSLYGYVVPGTPLNEREQATCRCVLHVAAKNPRWCNKEKAWFAQRNGQKCYNPYAVCASSTGQAYPGCSEWYNYFGIPTDELIAYADLRGIPVPEGKLDDDARKRLIHNIATYWCSRARLEGKKELLCKWAGGQDFAQQLQQLVSAT